jgi:hypothetical protein
MNDVDRFLDGFEQIVKQQRVTEEDAFNAGRDAGLNGVNETNCHFRYFGSPALTGAWERGKKAASNS